MQIKKVLFLFLIASSVNVVLASEGASSSSAAAGLDELAFVQPQPSAYVRAKKMIADGQSPVLESSEDLEAAFAQAVDAKDVDAAKKIGIEIKRQEDGIAINFISDNKVMTTVATLTIAVVIGTLSYLAKKGSGGPSSGGKPTFMAPASSSSSSSSSL